MGQKCCFHDSQSPGMFGGDKLGVAWLPDGEVLIYEELDPDLAFALAWWEREWCWFNAAENELDDLIYNYGSDSPALQREVNRRRADVERARRWFYERIHERTGFLHACLSGLSDPARLGVRWS